ncbi:MAG TPA: copper chaperone PCu(A)C [Micropepsaceae bacterium]|nr:copper chaperone PCu(A)C [Micropepsaceae bacterium]
MLGSSGRKLAAVLTALLVPQFAAGIERTTKLAPVKISDAWIRALPAGVPAAGYFRIHNAGTARLTMNRAESSSCGTLMLHKTMKVAGRADMEAMTMVDISPGGDAVFEPGGYHLMCMNPAASLKPGGKTNITFFFSDGSKTDAEFVVRDARGN